MMSLIVYGMVFHAVKTTVAGTAKTGIRVEDEFIAFEIQKDSYF